MAQRFTRSTIPGSEFVRPQIVDGTSVPAPPVVTPDLQVRLDPPRNEHTDSGEDTILDVQSDHRYPIISWIYSIQHQIQNSVYTSSPIASPASLLAYTYMLYIGLFFQIDAKLRPSPSPQAATILNDFYGISFFDSLLDFMVPNFAVTEFATLSPFQDELARNLMYFGTLAGSSLTQDFGRLFPVYTFIMLHNILGTLPNNSTYANLVKAFYGTTVATLRFPGQNADVNILPSHLFGRFVDNGAADQAHANHVYRNWFNDIIDRFLTTNAIRVVNATATITRIPIFTPPTVNTDNFNAYLMCSGLTPQNITQLTHFMRNMHDFVSAHVPSRRLLRDFTTVGSSQIATHLCFESAIPTWHTLGVHEISDADVTRESRTRVQFATAITYMTDREPLPANAGNNVVDARRPDDPATTPANGAIFSLVAATVDPRPPAGRGLRILSAANVNFYDLPRPFIFDPISSQTEHHGSVIVSGILIESNDISSIGITLPRLRFSLGTQNSDFLGGALPLTQITPQISSNRIITRRRNWTMNARLLSLVHRGFQNSVVVPAFSAGLVRLGMNTPQASYPPIRSVFPGAITQDNATDAYDGLNVYVHPIGSPRTDTAPENFILWSSYRYFDIQSQTWYMLPSLRQIYGARARFSVSAHPADRIH